MKQSLCSAQKCKFHEYIHLQKKYFELKIEYYNTISLNLFLTHKKLIWMKIL